MLCADGPTEALGGFAGGCVVAGPFELTTGGSVVTTAGLVVRTGGLVVITTGGSLVLAGAFVV